VSTYRFVMAEGTFDSVGVEREHLAGRPVEVTMARLATAEEIERETADADAVIVTWNPLPAELIDRLGPKLRIIARCGIGLDAIDLAAARARGLAVFHCPDYATEEVATHTLAMILALDRKLVGADAAARRDWMAWHHLKPVRPLSEQTAGVVGLGRIGRAVAERLQPLFGSVLGFDPFVESAPEGVQRVSTLDELLAASDVLTLHTALTDETRGLLGRRELSLLKLGAILVNVSRGGLIDTRALIDALHEGRIGGAGLDVLANEPPPPDDPVMGAPNVLLSPHFAWYSEASERRARTMTADGLLDYLEGRPLRGGRLAVEP
jgi:D-3-phosphoglycerate dehydrogenase / 2-oxoglutarate reductase